MAYIENELSELERQTNSISSSDGLTGDKLGALTMRLSVDEKLVGLMRNLGKQCAMSRFSATV